MNQHSNPVILSDGVRLQLSLEVYFHELFDEKKWLYSVFYTPEKLQCDMQARFSREYNLDDIAQWLKDKCAHWPDKGYEIDHIDFN